MNLPDLLARAFAQRRHQPRDDCLQPPEPAARAGDLGLSAEADARSRL